MCTREDRLLEVKDLQIRPRIENSREGKFPAAVNGLNFSLPRGRTLCLVGESGCGKSMVCKAIASRIRLREHVVSGQFLFYPENRPAALKDPGSSDPKQAEGNKPDDEIPGPTVAMVGQEPIPSLSELFTIGSQITRIIQKKQKVSKLRAQKRTVALLAELGVQQPERLIYDYPIHLSRETRLRVILAMALSCEPSLLIIDDPVTMLDLPNRLQILERIATMQQETGMAVLCATRDLSLAKQLADDLVIMYQGKIVEMGHVCALFSEPEHPYTRALLKRQEVLSQINADIRVPPHLFDPPAGCAYQPFCPSAMSICAQYEPRLVTVSDRHDVRCFNHEIVPMEALDPLEQSASDSDVWQLERFLMR